MDQLVKALHKGSKAAVNGHNASNESCDADHSFHSVVTSDGSFGDDIPAAELYRQVQHGGDIPFLGLQKHVPEKPASFRFQTSDVIRKSLPSKDEELDEAAKKKKLEELVEKGRRKHLQEEAAKNEMRKHHDFFTPSQKLPISPNRYENVVVSTEETSSPSFDQWHDVRKHSLTSPEKWRGFQVLGKARARFDFVAQNTRELSFKADDILYLLHQIDQHWFVGEHYGQVGLVPVSYIQIWPTSPKNQDTIVGLARAKFDFNVQSPAELALKKGDFVTVLRRVDKNWLEGFIGNRQGIFPASYVSLIREPPALSFNNTPSVITTTQPETPEMLSPMSWNALSPPPQPSPLTQFFPETLESGHKQSRRFLFGSPSSNNITTFDPKEILSSSTLNEDFQMHRSRLKPLENDRIGCHQDIEHLLSPARKFLNESWSPVSDNNSQIDRYVAVRSYHSQSPHELELETGDEVFVTGKFGDGWLLGTSTRTWEYGSFPASYVQKCC